MIDMKDWERSGGGGTGWSYINRNDSSIMLKLNKKEISKVVEYIFNLTRGQFKRFLELYGREYYGDRWGSRELKQKLDAALSIRVALTIANRPRAAKLYLPFLRGQKLKFTVIMRVLDILVRKFN